MLVMTALLSCRHKEPDRPQPEPTSPSETSATGETGLSTPPMRSPEAPVPPSVTILGVEELGLGFCARLLPVFGDDPSVLVLGTTEPGYGTNNYPLDLVFVPGLLPRGEHTIFEVWDGVSGYDYYIGEFFRTTGDYNNDGHLDVWIGEELFLGPLLGRSFHRMVDNQAYVEGLNEWAVAGDFDADGDGHLDVLMKADVGAWSFIRYGPFEGALPSAVDGVADPATYTRFGETSFCSESDHDTAILRDHLGPGRDAVMVGADQDGWCTLDAFLWDLQRPRGMAFRYDQALAAADGINSIYGQPFDDLGDLDGDGIGDAIWGDYTGSILFKGPMSGILEFVTNDDPHVREQIGSRGHVGNAVGDINGDGQPELVGVWTPADADGSLWVLLLSPFDDPIDVSVGIELGALGEHPFTDLGRVDGDLDGDGRTDLVAHWRAPGDAVTTIAIWYGSDLLAAWEARQAAR